MPIDVHEWAEVAKFRPSTILSILEKRRLNKVFDKVLDRDPHRYFDKAHRRNALQMVLEDVFSTIACDKDCKELEAILNLEEIITNFAKAAVAEAGTEAGDRIAKTTRTLAKVYLQYYYSGMVKCDPDRLTVDDALRMVGEGPIDETLFTILDRVERGDTDSIFDGSAGLRVTGWRKPKTAAV